MDDAASDRPPERTVRRGEVSWLTDPPSGTARIDVESRGLRGPVSVPEGDPIPLEATPGELLAITHAIGMAWALAERLKSDGTPAHELVVKGECSFDGPVAERRLVAVDLAVRGRVPGLEGSAFDEAATAARTTYLRSCGAREDIAGELKTELAAPYEVE